MSASKVIQETTEGTVLLPDGTSAVLRRLTAADIEIVQRLYEQMPDRDIYLRFFGLSRRTALRAAQLVVAEDSVAVGLFRGGRLEGVANFRGAEPPDVAIVVAHPQQHHGIGTVLLEALVALARERGFRALSADVLSANSAMLTVLADSGLALDRRYDGSVTHLLIEVPERADAAYAAALSRRRDQAANARMTLMAARPLEQYEPR